jgi:hypothetical protein
MDNRPTIDGKREVQPPSSSIFHSVADVERRLRTLEERYSTLDRRSQVTEENMINGDRKIRAEIKIINEELPEMKAQISDLVEKVRVLVRELQGFAKTEDVEVIRKYLNLIEPLGFVTQNEVDRIVQGAVRAALDQQLAESGEKQ